MRKSIVFSLANQSDQTVIQFYKNKANHHSSDYATEEGELDELPACPLDCDEAETPGMVTRILPYPPGVRVLLTWDSMQK